jgi:hypothetical protein
MGNGSIKGRMVTAKFIFLMENTSKVNLLRARQQD